MKNGILIINKPEGITSAKTVSKIKETLKLKKTGHTGTLDPFATGVLIVCLGRATKISKYLSDLNKTYDVTMILGISTNTQDVKGKVTKINSFCSKQITPEKIIKAFQKFIGELWQTPPMFSAVRYKGVRLYKLARKGIKVNPAPRKIKIHKLDINKINIDKFPSICFRVHCSKGTYIRTLCNDIGQVLGVGAFVSNLRRVKVGKYSIFNSISLEKFLKTSEANRYKYIISEKEALDQFNKIILPEDNNLIKTVKNGGNFSEIDNSIKIIKNDESFFNDKYTVLLPDGELLAIAQLKKFKPNNKKVFEIEKVFT